MTVLTTQLVALPVVRSTSEALAARDVCPLKCIVYKICRIFVASGAGTPIGSKRIACAPVNAPAPGMPGCQERYGTEALRVRAVLRVPVESGSRGPIRPETPAPKLC